MSSSRNVEEDEGIVVPFDVTTSIDITQPIHPGMFLKNRYILVTEIGSGANAVVYLAYDTKYDNYYAIKIQNPSSYKGGKREIQILADMKKKIIEKELEIDNVCINLALESFTYIDPEKKDEADDEKTYHCMVFELYEQSINHIIDSGQFAYGISLRHVKRMIKQILSSLNFFHKEMGLVHTDVKPENILYCGGNAKYISIMNDIAAESPNLKTRFIEVRDHYQSILDKIANDVTLDEDKRVKKISKIKFEYKTAVEEIAVEYLAPIIFNHGFNEGDEESENDEDDDESTPAPIVKESQPKKKEKHVNKRKQERPDYPSDLEVSKQIDIDRDTLADFITEPLNIRNPKSMESKIVTEQQLRHIVCALTDFGSSRKIGDETRDKEVSPRFIRAPEVILGLNFDEKIDIWGLGNCVFQLLTGYELFDPHDEPTGHMDREHLYQIVKQFGKIPDWMIENSPRKDFLFVNTSNGYQIRGLAPFKPYPLRDRLIRQFQFSEEDANEACVFLYKVFEIDPRKRSSAEELLNDPWLKDRFFKDFSL